MTGSKALLMSTVVLATIAFSGASLAGPKKPKAPKPPVVATEEAIPFDRSAAANVLSQVDLVKCKTTPGGRGEGHVTMKFTPAGSATEAVVDKGPMVGTPAAKCIAKEFKKARIPAFKGDTVQVGKSFRFE